MSTRYFYTLIIFMLSGAVFYHAAEAASSVLGDELFKLTASDAADDDEFGGSSAISGNTAIVGAEEGDDAGTESGAA